MIDAVMVALGSALGAVSRHAVAHWFSRFDFSRPVASTLVVNLSGCLAAGLLAGLLDPSDTFSGSLLMTGFLGSYTTISAFSLETLDLWQSGCRWVAAGYALVSLLGGLALAGFGLVIAGGSGP